MSELLIKKLGIDFNTDEIISLQILGRNSYCLICAMLWIVFFWRTVTNVHIIDGNSL